ncbi:MAG: AAA family ATPase [Acidobacteriota bacterium]|nr:AAA family ATPase [Acidobacteriota bacterium]
MKWLKELKFKQLELKPEGQLLDRVIAFVNQEEFLPHHARLTEISSDGVIFTDGEDHQVSVEELSDGYRSVLSMTFELIRQMARVFTPEQIFPSGDSSKVIPSGVVLIDEIDAHLHPTWQRRIGLWFREHFPNIQFIVTTHSPLVCQAAEHGSVWRLPQPGSGEKAEMVTGLKLDRLLYGNVLEAYGTELFGKDVGRSESGKEMLQRLAELNVKELQAGLSHPEVVEQQSLRASAPTRPHKDTDRKPPVER